METKVSAQKIFDKYYSELELNEKCMDNGYTYESKFIEMVRKVGTEVLQVSTGRVPKGENGEKKSKPM